MKAFTTKNWQTAGIQEVEGNEDNLSGRDGFYGRIKSDKYDRGSYLGPSQWHRTVEEANIAADKKRKVKIAALQKQIEKLQAMQFVSANITG